MSKRRNIIGIVAASMGERAFGVSKMYLHHLQTFGDVIMLTPMHDIIEGLDLVVLPGGQDTYSGGYGQVPGYFNSNPDQYKEWFIDNNLDKYIDAGVPVWGTCLGLQQLIVHFGGQLTQDLYGHETSPDNERGKLVNKLKFTNKFLPLQSLILNKTKENAVKVCSLHHQGAMIDQVPDCFDVVATCDGIVEAIRHKTLPISAGQFHVEEDWNPLGMWLIEELLTKSKNNASTNKAVEKRTAEVVS